MNLPPICESPIFIIGSPRSGTSILAWALAQHSALTTADESNMFFELFRDNQLMGAYERATARPDSGDWLRRFDVGLDEFIASIGLGLNSLVTSRSGGKRWIDQTPANTMVAPALAQAFPGAKFIHILRDGRAVVNSMVNFAAAFEPAVRDKFLEAGAMPTFATDFRFACMAWTQYVEAAHQFVQANPGRATTVHNEMLREAAETGFEMLLSFLNLGLEPAVPAYFRDNKLNSSFPDTSIPGGRDEPWEMWSDEQQAIFNEIAAPTMGLVSAAAQVRL